MTEFIGYVAEVGHFTFETKLTCLRSQCEDIAGIAERHSVGLMRLEAMGEDLTRS